MLWGKLMTGFGFFRGEKKKKQTLCTNTYFKIYFLSNTNYFNNSVNQILQTTYFKYEVH